MKKYQYANYMPVTLKETRAIVEKVAEERKWSPSSAADELIKAGAIAFGVHIPNGVQQ